MTEAIETRSSRRDDLVRRALWASVPFNLLGALLFAFPDSLGRLAEIPGTAPGLYRASLALFVALFGGAYAWLASQPHTDRPLVALSAIGKASFFMVAVACWLGGAAPLPVVAAASGDLAFAAIFAWWLLGSR